MSIFFQYFLPSFFYIFGVNFFLISPLLGNSDIDLTSQDDEEKEEDEISSKPNKESR